MEMSSETNKKRKKDSRKKNKRTIELLSAADLEELAAIKQAKSLLKVSPSDRTQWRPMLFEPNEQNINAAHHLTWNIGPFRDAEFKFHDKHPLMILWKFQIKVKEADPATGKPKTNAEELKLDLKPEEHNCSLWPSTGATGYFSKVRTSYNGFVTNDTEVLHSLNLDELNTTASMDMFLNPNEDDLKQSKAFGNIPLYNNFGKSAAYIRSQLEETPNLNYPDPSAAALSPAGEGYRFAYGKLPCVPFTKFSPRMKKKMTGNSGGDTREEASSIIFPPKTMFRFDFSKTPKENYLHDFYWAQYSDIIASRQAPLTKDVYEYRKFITAAKVEYCITGLDIDVDKIFLRGFIRQISETLKNRLPLFNTYCTARRIQEIKLDDNKYPIMTYFIDQQSLGLGFVLMFRRELDMERDPTQPHPFSSQTCYRPNSLNRITILEGGDQGGEPIIFNEMDINNLAYENMDPTMWKFAEIAHAQGWISSNQIRNFWEMPYAQKSAREGGALGTGTGNVGVSNYFPVSLLDKNIRQNFAYFSSNGLKSNSLQIKLEFTTPLTAKWYMLIVSEYLVSLTFDSTTGNPSFHVV